mmetsp:Transcript_3377/g.6942  ORF Transcript_3377/g.6942 Transcript_3377/m.6942 type:complete len:183 (+) Transcript_3377:208-756(+)
MATLVIADTPRPLALSLLVTILSASYSEYKALYLTYADKAVPQVALEERQLKRILVKFISSQEALRNYLADLHLSREVPIAIAIDALNLDFNALDELRGTLALVANLGSILPPTTKILVVAQSEELELSEVWQVYSRFFAEVYVLKRLETMTQLYLIDSSEGRFELKVCRDPVFSSALDKLH